MFKRIKAWLRVIVDFSSSVICVKNSTLLNTDETVNYVKNSNKSIIRFGDGEFNILMGRGISYQSFNPELQKDLFEIIDNYPLGYKNNYLLCMPTPFFKCNGLKLLKKREYVASWATSRRAFKEKYDNGSTYGDAFVFANGNKEYYKLLWEAKKIVIFVHNDEKYAKAFNREYQKTTIFVKIPPKDAYEQKELILSNILKEGKNYKKEEILILISAGPCGKVLVKKLSDLDLIAYDTGHCWDEPLDTL
ncbi:GT-D fold domain-containing glycosyltransferase [Bacillus cereus]|uniref:GT-D fold domain-containing glycosyltransferase n=1 Tax=Bacillus TaxID=1386 RepID=UPI0011231024|nr:MULTISPECIES: GT-D fold domain-containing glycosyltransferase [Bacillus]TNP23057.1 DUF1792 domain-containing protein [Bacillus sp. CD3-5]